MVELALGSTFTTLSSIGNFTSDCLSVPEEVPKHPRKLSRNSSMFEETDSKFVMVVALLTFQGQYLSDKWPLDLLVNVTATNDTLQSTCLTLCLRNFTEAAKTLPTIFPPIIKRLFLVKRMSAVKRIFPCCQLL